MSIASYSRWLLLTGLIIAADQASKLLIEHNMDAYTSIPLIPGLSLTLLYNPGAAFSFLSDAGGWQRWFFTGLSSVISLVLLVWIKRLQANERLLACALSLILGGAIGNLIDRIAYGHVVDFIDVYYQSHHFPAFNIADSAISIGAVLLLLQSFWERPKTTVANSVND